jgi:outer membrane protein
VDFALNNNYTLKASEFAANAALHAARAKKAEHLPTLTGQITYFDNSSDSVAVDQETNERKPFSNDSDGHVFLLKLDMPLYSGGRISSQRREAYERYNASYETWIGTRRNTVQSTRSFHLAMSTDVARVNARRASIVSAQSALDATQAGYDVGTRTVVDVLEAQRILYSAMRDYANARYDYVRDMLLINPPAPTKSGN